MIVLEAFKWVERYYQVMYEVELWPGQVTQMES